jgi:general stress protein CsbA
MWKTAIFAVFSRASVKKSHFSSVFRGFLLAFSKRLGYSAAARIFRRKHGGESAADLDHLETQ